MASYRIILNVRSDAGSEPYLACGKHINVSCCFYDYNLLSASQERERDVLYLREGLLRKTCINYVFSLTLTMSQQNKPVISRYLVISPFLREKILNLQKAYREFPISFVFYFVFGEYFYLFRTFLCPVLDFISQQYPNYHVGQMVI